MAKTQQEYFERGQRDHALVEAGNIFAMERKAWSESSKSWQALAYWHGYQHAQEVADGKHTPEAKWTRTTHSERLAILAQCKLPSWNASKPFANLPERVQRGISHFYDLAENLTEDTPAEETLTVPTMRVPAAYWDDFSERSPCDNVADLPTEVSRSGRIVTITALPGQVACILGDAEFYAGGNTDGTPASVIRGARSVVELCKLIQQEAGTTETPDAQQAEKVAPATNTEQPVNQILTAPEANVARTAMCAMQAIGPAHGCELQFGEWVYVRRLFSGVVKLEDRSNGDTERYDDLQAFATAYGLPQ